MAELVRDLDRVAEALDDRAADRQARPVPRRPAPVVKKHALAALLLLVLDGAGSTIIDPDRLDGETNLPNAPGGVRT